MGKKGAHMTMTHIGLCTSIESSQETDTHKRKEKKKKTSEMFQHLMLSIRLFGSQQHRCYFKRTVSNCKSKLNSRKLRQLSMRLVSKENQSIKTAEAKNSITDISS